MWRYTIFPQIGGRIFVHYDEKEMLDFLVKVWYYMGVNKRGARSEIPGPTHRPYNGRAARIHSAPGVRARQGLANRV